MTHQRDIKRLLDEWFSDGPAVAPDRVIDVVADRIERQPQRSAWRLRWRDGPMSLNRRWAGATAVLAAAVIVAVISFKVVGNPPGSGLGTPPTPTPTPTPTDAPRPTLTASPAATPSPTVPVASSIDPVVLLRVEIRGDVSVGRIPLLTVYRDGSVLRPGDDANGRITRLTPQGVSLLLDPAMASDLLVTSGRIGPDPAYQGGFTSYSIDLRRGEEIVHRSTTNSLTTATRAEGERIIALAEYLGDLESWLPADAWAIADRTDSRCHSFLYKPARRAGCADTVCERRG